MLAWNVFQLGHRRLHRGLRVATLEEGERTMSRHIQGAQETKTKSVNTMINKTNNDKRPLTSD